MKNKEKHLTNEIGGRTTGVEGFKSNGCRKKSTGLKTTIAGE